MREKSPETYEEKLAHLQELREQAIHTNPQAEEKQHDARQADRARADREAARPGLASRSSTRSSATARATSGCSTTAPGATPWSPARHDRRPPGGRLLAGLHGLRRLARRGDGREDGEGDGPGGQDRLPGHRHQRLRRRAHPGGRRLAGRLRRRVRPQRAVLRRDPADLGDHGPVRGRRRLLPGHDRLHLHGQGDLAHVHHRPRRDQDGHGRGGGVRGARRRDDAQLEVGRRALRGRRRGELPRGRALPHVVPAAEQPRDPAADGDGRRPGPPGRGARPHRPGQPEQAVRHARRGAPDRRQRRVLRGAGALRAQHRRSASRG